MIFQGGKRNTTVRRSNLIAFQTFADGLVLEKASGRTPHRILEGVAEMAAVILVGKPAKAAAASC